MNFASYPQYAAVDLAFGRCRSLHVPQLIVAQLTISSYLVTPLISDPLLQFFHFCGN